MNSIIVYSDSSRTNKERVICKNIVPQQSNFYGNSKLYAQERIKSLESNDFRVLVSRLPIIYGNSSNCSYPRLIM